VIVEILETAPDLSPDLY